MTLSSVLSEAKLNFILQEGFDTKERKYSFLVHLESDVGCRAVVCWNRKPKLKTLNPESMSYANKPRNRQNPNGLGLNRSAS